MFADRNYLNENIYTICFIDRYFDCVDVCKVRPNWSEVRLEGEFPNGKMDFGSVNILHVFSPTDVDLTLFQTSDRYVGMLQLLLRSILT